MTAKPFARLAAVLAVPLALAACSGGNPFVKKEPPPCPPIYILGDAGQITKFREGKGRDLTDVEVEAEITGYSGECSYDEKGAIVDIQVSLVAKRGPADTDRKAQLSYFVAIPAFYPKAEAKAVFPVEITFPEGTNSVRFTDETVTMRVPVKDKEVINKYEIYLGFQTSAEELEMNRRAR